MNNNHCWVPNKPKIETTMRAQYGIISWNNLVNPLVASNYAGMLHHEAMYFYSLALTPTLYIIAYPPCNLQWVYLQHRLWIY